MQVEHALGSEFYLALSDQRRILARLRSIERIAIQIQ
jgi:hypothetical protein